MALFEANAGIGRSIEVGNPQNPAAAFDHFEIKRGKLVFFGAQGGEVGQIRPHGLISAMMRPGGPLLLGFSGKEKVGGNGSEAVTDAEGERPGILG